MTISARFIVSFSLRTGIAKNRTGKSASATGLANLSIKFDGPGRSTEPADWLCYLRLQKKLLR
jgi:hypothetical protein